MKLKRALIVLVSAALCLVMFSACSSGGEDVEISSQDAAKLIQTYSSEELGLEDDISNHSVLTSSDQEIDGYDGMFYKVIVADVAEPDENGYVGNIEPIVTFYISYDGKTILSYDQTTGEYTEFKDVHDVPTTEAITDSFDIDETESEEEDDETQETDVAEEATDAE